MKNIVLSLTLILLFLIFGTPVVADTYYSDPGLKVDNSTTAEEYQQILKGGSELDSDSSKENGAQYGFEDFDTGEAFQTQQVSVSGNNDEDASDDNTSIDPNDSNAGSVILPSGDLQIKRPAPQRPSSGGRSFSEVVEYIHDSSTN